MIKASNRCRYPLVSVCIITYNHKNYISQCLDGLLMQKTTFPFEIILGEDESSDGTREICIEYANKYPDKIRLFLRSRKDVVYINKNPTGIFNFKECLKSATGKYIAICEGDDYWTFPDKLQNQVDFMEANPDYNICFHNAVIKYGDTEKPDAVFSDLKGNKLEKAKEIYAMEELIWEEPLIPTASLLFRSKEPFTLPEWFRNIMDADMALAILVCGEGKIRYFDDCWSVYRKHKGGVSNIIVGDFKHCLRIRMFHLLLKHFRGAYKESFIKIIRHHMNNLQGFPGLSIRELWDVFRLFPVPFLKKQIASLKGRRLTTREKAIVQ